MLEIHGSTFQIETKEKKETENKIIFSAKFINKSKHKKFLLFKKFILRCFLFQKTARSVGPCAVAHSLRVVFFNERATFRNCLFLQQKSIHNNPNTFIFEEKHLHAWSGKTIRMCLPEEGKNYVLVRKTNVIHYFIKIYKK